MCRRQVVCLTTHRLSVHSTCRPHVSSPLYETDAVGALLDTDAFKADLASSSLVQCPPDDVDELFTAYSDTLSSLVDKAHAATSAACLDTKPGSVV